MSFFSQTMGQLKLVARGIARAMKVLGHSLIRGMRFIGRVVIKVSKFAGHTVVRITRVTVGKFGDFFEKRHLKSRIKKGKTKAAAYKSDIGTYYWDKCKSGTMFWDEEIDEVCRALRAVEGDITACEAQMLNLREKIYGPDGRACVDDVEEFEFEGDVEKCQHEKTGIEEYNIKEYRDEGHADQEHVEQVNTDQEYVDQGHVDQGHADQEYVDQGHVEQVNADQEYDDRGHVDQEYADQGYVDQKYVDQGYEVVEGIERYGNDSVPSFIQFRTPSITQNINDTGEELVSHRKTHKVSRKDNRGFWEGEDLTGTASEEFISSEGKLADDRISQYGKNKDESLHSDNIYEPYEEKDLDDAFLGHSRVSGYMEGIYCEFCGYANAPGVDVCERCGALVE